MVVKAKCTPPSPVPGGSAPTVTTHPSTAVSVAKQGTASSALSVAVSGTTPFTYQWYAHKNGQSTIIPEATNLSYSPLLWEVVDNGTTYFCMISNDYGSSVSNLSGPHLIVDANFCSFDTPNFVNGELGTVEFRTTQTWTVGSQVWSDAVTATGCNKTHGAYNGVAAAGYSADCYRNSYGDLISWCAIMRFADVLCPDTWRVPTTEEFRLLNAALGGSAVAVNGSYKNTTILNRYINSWGGRYGGLYDGTATESLGTCARYWTQTESGQNGGYYMTIYSSSSIHPQRNDNGKLSAFTLRCVK